MHPTVTEQGSRASEITPTLIELLASFNRKERNLLFRDVIGSSSKPPSLNPDFVRRINETLGKEHAVASDAWWSTDYHFDWLFAGVRMKSGTIEVDVPFVDDKHVLTATPEDVDLVIADETTLLLIEAKAYGAHSNAQIRSKRIRFDALASMLVGTGIDAKLLLLSPRRPKKVILQPGEKELPWLKLMIDDTRPLYGLARTDSDRKHSKTAGYWTVRDVRKLPPDDDSVA